MRIFSAGIDIWAFIAFFCFHILIPALAAHDAPATIPEYEPLTFFSLVDSIPNWFAIEQIFGNTVRSLASAV